MNYSDKIIWWPLPNMVYWNNTARAHKFHCYCLVNNKLLFLRLKIKFDVYLPHAINGHLNSQYPLTNFVLIYWRHSGLMSSSFDIRQSKSYDHTLKSMLHTQNYILDNRYTPNIRWHSWVRISLSCHRCWHDNAKKYSVSLNDRVSFSEMIGQWLVVMNAK